MKLTLKVFSEISGFVSSLQVKHAVVFTRLQRSTCKHLGYANTDPKVLVGKYQSPRLKPVVYGRKVLLFVSELVGDRTFYHV